MPAPGCFGSSLAFDAGSPNCTACAAHADCATMVDKRRPQMMRLLDRFSDGTGKKMSEAWKTRAEKAAARKKPEPTPPAPMPDEEGVMALKTHLDLRAHSTIDKMVRNRIDPRHAHIEVVAGVNRIMAAVISALRERPHTMRELTACIAQSFSLSAQNAQRSTYATVSILTVCKRVQRNGATLELK
ncbi:hypothetical protein SAMN03159338_1577 [Sphingomonas sp. NFR04]|uniref:hypothetical protein n=1 Tax=Sphingomonas sp. NFR04 TaxID=1566283 RepID=UPI0008EF906E|nr:hypothetical protein [Sphingomonas sp. NFR04]SFJ49939.1 hypothetical protein SAMN03159338_1577 [Sphingomonas sp. NFR04]